MFTRTIENTIKDKFNLIIPLGYAMGFRFFSLIEGRCQPLWLTEG